MDINSDLVREFLDYNPETGALTWLQRDRKWFISDSTWRTFNKRNAGKRAGGLDVCGRSGYQARALKIFRKAYMEHRIAWMWMTDEPLPEFIDHINQNATDNRWSNLRASTVEQNNRNCSLRRSNTSGITGVSWSKGSGKWVACVRLNYKLHKLGLFNDINEAAKAVETFRSANGFDASHGKHEAHYRE